jgi:hypothetical protein
LTPTDLEPFFSGLASETTGVLLTFGLFGVSRATEVVFLTLGKRG